MNSRVDKSNIYHKKRYIYIYIYIYKLTSVNCKQLYIERTNRNFRTRLKKNTGDILYTNFLATLYRKAMGKIEEIMTLIHGK